MDGDDLFFIAFVNEFNAELSVSADRHIFVNASNRLHYGRHIVPEELENGIPRSQSLGNYILAIACGEDKPLFCLWMVEHRVKIDAFCADAVELDWAIAILVSLERFQNQRFSFKFFDLDEVVAP